jgi:hypothetical protein
VITPAPDLPAALGRASNLFVFGFKMVDPLPYVLKRILKVRGLVF